MEASLCEHLFWFHWAVNIMYTCRWHMTGGRGDIRCQTEPGSEFSVQQQAFGLFHIFGHCWKKRRKKKGTNVNKGHGCLSLMEWLVNKRLHEPQPLFFSLQGAQLRFLYEKVLFILLFHVDPRTEWQRRFYRRIWKAELLCYFFLQGQRSFLLSARQS